MVAHSESSADQFLFLARWHYQMVRLVAKVGVEAKNSIGCALKWRFLVVPPWPRQWWKKELFPVILRLGKVKFTIEWCRKETCRVKIDEQRWRCWFSVKSKGERRNIIALMVLRVDNWPNGGRSGYWSKLEQKCRSKQLAGGGSRRGTTENGFIERRVIREREEGVKGEEIEERKREERKCTIENGFARVKSLIYSTLGFFEKFSFLIIKS